MLSDAEEERFQELAARLEADGVRAPRPGTSFGWAAVLVTTIVATVLALGVSAVLAFVMFCAATVVAARLTTVAAATVAAQKAELARRLTTWQQQQ